MKICLAQIQSEKGAIKSNISNHIKWVKKAISEHSDLIVFPELSLTGFEPQLAKELAILPTDERLNEFQQLSDLNRITIGIGVPTKSDSGVLISMLIFQPNQPRTVYSKQMLHEDELPYFIPGNEQLILEIKNTKIALAICYESLQPEHAAHTKKLGADVYLASVAKPKNGIEKANICYPKTAQEHLMPVLMVNCVGYCDNFHSVGQSSVWDANGVLIGQLDNKHEGLLIFDTKNKTLKML